jgi:radical SAM protein with 4Fe4S-binding SPASM domain
MYAQSYTFGVFWKLRKSIFRTLRHPRKVVNFMLSRLSQLLKRERVSGYPPLLLIEPTSYCNLQCPMCARNFMAGQIHAGNMSLASFQHLLADIGDYLLFLLIFGYGEPLLNPDILEMIRLAKAKDIFVVMSTNGVLLDQPKVDRMLEAPPDLLIISLDAVREETYKKYRVGGDFHKVLANIRYLSEQKAARRTATPLVDLQFLAMKDNEEELISASEIVKNLGADKYSVKKVARYYSDPEFAGIKSLLPREHPEFVYSIYADPAASIGKFCSLPWRQTAITWDGKIIPCCKDIDACHVLGTAFDGKPFKEKWNNERFLAWRANVKNDIDRIDICKGCNRRVECEGFLE